MHSRSMLIVTGVISLLMALVTLYPVYAAFTGGRGIGGGDSSGAFGYMVLTIVLALWGYLRLRAGIRGDS